MGRLQFANKRIIATYLFFFALALVATMLPLPVVKFHHIQTFSYITIIIIWAVRIRKRIVDPEVRHRILIACFFMILLFFLRMCKYSYFDEDDLIREYIWYAYTIPLTLIPLFMFMAFGTEMNSP